MNDPLGNTANDKNEVLHSYREGGNQTLAAIFLSTWSRYGTGVTDSYETNADHTLDSDKVPSPKWHTRPQHIWKMRRFPLIL